MGDSVIGMVVVADASVCDGLSSWAVVIFPHFFPLNISQAVGYPASKKLRHTYNPAIKILRVCA